MLSRLSLPLLEARSGLFLPSLARPCGEPSCNCSILLQLVEREVQRILELVSVLFQYVLGAAVGVANAAPVARRLSFTDLIQRSRAIRTRETRDISGSFVAVQGGRVELRHLLFKFPVLWHGVSSLLYSLLVSWFWSFTMRPTRARQTDSSLVLWLRQDREKARVVAPALEIGGARTVAGAAARLSGKPVSARPGLP